MAEKEGKVNFIYMDPDLLEEHQINKKHSTFIKNLKENTKFVYYIYGPVLLFTDVEKEINYYLRYPQEKTNNQSVQVLQRKVPQQSQRQDQTEKSDKIPLYHPDGGARGVSKGKSLQRNKFGLLLLQTTYIWFEYGDAGQEGTGNRSNHHGTWEAFETPGKPHFRSMLMRNCRGTSTTLSISVQIILGWRSPGLSVRKLGSWF